MLLKRISKIHANHSECRFAAVLHKSEYDLHYKRGERPKKIPLDTMYGICFRMCLSFAIDMIQDVIKWADPQIDFVLEAGHRNMVDAKRIFDQIKKEVPDLRNLLGTISFGEKESAPGLQGADAVAYFALRSEREGDAELADFRTESTLEYARRTASSKSPIFRLGGRSDILAAMRENLVTLEEFRRQRSSPSL